MKSIQSLDDLKEHKDEILNFIEESIKYGVESLQNILKASLSIDETKIELDKFQAGHELFSEELQHEFDRIANISGAQDYIESLRDEMEKRLEPHAQAIADNMGKIMASMMGQFIDGVGEIMDSVSNLRKDVEKDDIKKDNEEEEEYI
jgi:hypothetical protein